VRYLRAGFLQKLTSRNPSEAELDMYAAFARWYLSYRPSPLDDINLIEAWKAGWAARTDARFNTISTPDY
jgi:hypothetical protein